MCVCASTLRWFVCLHLSLIQAHPCTGQSNLLRILGSWQDRSKWCRNLHRLIHRFGLMLSVTITSAPVPVSVGGTASRTLPWPTLRFSDWVRCVFRMTDGQPLLCGHSVENEAAWQGMLLDFWENARPAFSSHRVYQDKKNCLHLCVPIMLHGDEGRGKLRRCVMCQSVQPLLRVPGHTFSSRLLFAVFPGELYAGSSSVHMLQEHLTAGLAELYQNGISVL